MTDTVTLGATLADDGRIRRRDTGRRRWQPLDERVRVVWVGGE